MLARQGYCVFALDYGEHNGVAASGPVPESAAQPAVFVDRVLAATVSKRVDVVATPREA